MAIHLKENMIAKLALMHELEIIMVFRFSKLTAPLSHESNPTKDYVYLWT